MISEKCFVSLTRVHDPTLFVPLSAAAMPLEGYEEAKPMVFCGLYPSEADDYEVGYCPPFFPLLFSTSTREAVYFPIVLTSVCSFPLSFVIFVCRIPVKVTFASPIYEGLCVGFQGQGHTIGFIQPTWLGCRNPS